MLKPITVHDINLLIEEITATWTKEHDRKINYDKNDEQREAIRQRNTGRKKPPMTEVQKENHKQAMRSRAPLSEEKRREKGEKIRQAKLGKKTGPMSEERKENIRQSLLGKKGKPMTQATKDKISAFNLKRGPMSEEQKEKIRQAHLTFHRTKKSTM